MRIWDGLLSSGLKNLGEYWGYFLESEILACAGLGRASLVAQLVNNPPAMLETWVRALGSSPGLGRSPGEGKGYPLQYSGVENSHGLYSPWGRKELDTTEQLHVKKQESSRKTSIFALLTTPKPSTVWITINCGKF